LDLAWFIHVNGARQSTDYREFNISPISSSDDTDVESNGHDADADQDDGHDHGSSVDEETDDQFDFAETDSIDTYFDRSQDMESYV
jgi:hypothetical protein